MNKHAAFLVATVALVIVLASAGVRAASSCKLVRIDEWPVRLEHRKLLVDGEINGKKIGVLLDTGLMVSLVPRSFAIRLGLARQATRRLSYGVGGISYIEVVRLDELKINRSTRTDYLVYTAGERDFGTDIGFVIGEDFLAQLDVEFDLPHNAVRLFQTKDCGDASLAYWAPHEASELPIERVNDFHPQIVLAIEISGKSMKAQLDSGATVSVLTKSGREILGITPEMPGVVMFGKLVGSGAGAVDAWSAPVESIIIGNEKIRDTTIVFADIYDISAPRRNDMLLGMDFLLSHRVLVAHSQRKIYFTYEGGPVFQRLPLPGIPTRPGSEEASR